VNLTFRRRSGLFTTQSSEYLRWSFENNKSLNRNAAAMVVAVLQRRLASSTYAMGNPLERRRNGSMDADTAEAPAQWRSGWNNSDTTTADDSEPTDTGTESQERVEEQALTNWRNRKRKTARKGTGVSG